MSRDRHSRHHNYRNNDRDRDSRKERHGRDFHDSRDHNNNHNKEHAKDRRESNLSYEEKRAASKPVFHSSTNSVTIQQINEEEAAIRQFKSSNQIVCAKCGIAINDISNAITSKDGNGIIHFDCALEEISKTAVLGEGDKITYIGQGRFGIVNHPNPHDMKHFTIKSIIDWENKENKPEWRNEMAELYSHVR